MRMSLTEPGVGLSYSLFACYAHREQKEQAAFFALLGIYVVDKMYMHITLYAYGY